MTVSMLMMPPPTTRTRFADWPLALKSILGFWSFYALTVVARAFLGTDPLTTLQNRLVVIAIGIVLTGLIYLAIATFSEGAGIRRKAIIAAMASAAASLAMGSALIMLEDWLPKSKEQLRYQAREGFTVVEQGNRVPSPGDADQCRLIWQKKPPRLQPEQRR